MRVTCLRFARPWRRERWLRLDFVLNDFVAGAVAYQRNRQATNAVAYSSRCWIWHEPLVGP
jgi:hypothetical protein